VLFEDHLEREWQAGASDRFAAWSVNGSSARPLPSEGDGPRGVRPRPFLAHPVVHCHRSSTPDAAGWPDRSGYAREHYEVSRTIGERKLLPAARAAQAGTVLAASGVSCRQQVAHFTGVRAVHPAVLLRSLIEVR
jgi:hypothetical protein